MIDLTAKPFYLDNEGVEWVKKTIAGMTDDEKIGQLFIHLNLNRDPAYMKEICEKYHIGGLRWQGADALESYKQNLFFQTNSKIPLLIAANCEYGGSNMLPDGTLVATPAACGACDTYPAAYHLGRIGGREAAAVGCNWSFTPLVDILLNWRNSIVNTRSFGSDPERVTECAKAYRKGISESGIACCAKHFPGDGSEERDQHLVMGCNDLSCEEWDETFGKVYKALIDDGVESIMAGHICQPAYSRRLRPGISDSEIMPASLSPELLQDLLREQLGFNGLIVTDATHMAGFTSACSRKEQVQRAIASGCDMFLFMKDPAEDIGYLKEGYREGIITEERLSDALTRILGMKAHIGLHKLTFPRKEGLSVVGCREHLAVASDCADEAVTLVKDTQNLLPVNPKDKKRVMVYFYESAPVRPSDGTDPAKRIVVEELERVGFEVTLHENFYDMEAKESNRVNGFKIRKRSSSESYKQNYDIAMAFVNMQGFARESNMRVRYSSDLSNEMPWFVHEIPSLCVSLNYTNHLYDLPMFRTFINAYAPTREYIRATVEKIVGKSSFKGRYDDLVWCDRWDTKL